MATYFAHHSFQVCDNYDLCEKCFYSRRHHKHSFNRIAEPSSAAVFAGRPGRTRRRELAGAPSLSGGHGSYMGIGNSSMSGSGSLIEEWSQCVKSMGVSSRENWASRLTDGTSSYWQSCGSQVK